MKLDVTCMRYLGKDDYRLLTAIEMGMRNHELVPVELITSIAKLRHGGVHRILSTLLRHKLIAHANQQYNGYRLSYLGFDILALRALLARNVIASVGRQIGVGKESDVFEAQDEHGNELVLKIHRLGRTSFRSVRRNRDYMAGKSKASWLYMSRLAALKEFAFMQALHTHGFPTPTPIDHNRHIVAMSRIEGFPMSQIKAGAMEGAESVFANCLAILRRLAQCGLVHCDFNEFNLMVDQTGKVTLIDFPQMVSTGHVNASDLFARDMNGLVKFFAMKMHYVPDADQVLRLEDIPVIEAHIDEEVRASGFAPSPEEEGQLVGFLHATAAAAAEGEEPEDDEDGEEDDEDEGEELEELEEQEEQEEQAYEIGDDEAVPSSVFPSLEVASAPADDDVSELDGDEEAAMLGSLAGGAAPLAAEDLERVREQARYNLHRRGGRGGGSSSKKPSRNHTKERNKYGKVVRPEKLDAEW